MTISLIDNKRITTGFGAESTAAEVLAGLDLSGHRAIVTGAASGIGFETAAALAAADAEVTLAVRNLQAGARAAQQLAARTGNQQLRVAVLDLADQESVANFVANWHGPLDVLVNNAGLMAPPLTRTKQGWELQLATNHLGHFALATGLRPALAAAGGARVVSVSSVGHLVAGIDFEDLQFQRRPYDPWVAYGQSKTANVLFAVEASTRWAEDGIAVNALMPGRIDTNLVRYVDEQTIAAARTAATPWKTPQQGAATSALLAASPLVEGVSGRYFEDCNEAEAAQPGIRRGVADHALDPVSAARLWQISIELLAG